MPDFTYRQACYLEHDRWIAAKMLERIERQNMLET